MTSIADIKLCEKSKTDGILEPFPGSLPGTRLAWKKMLITEPCRQGVLLQRYKRFLADVSLEGGEVLTVHCPNSGSMLGCSAPGSRVVVSRSANPRRQYPWTLEMVRSGGTWIGVNTMRTNRLVKEGLESGIIDDFGGMKSIRPEVKISEKSRLDFLLQTERGSVYIEVKNCTLVEDGAAMFPDAVTTRGTRHLRELAGLAGSGTGAALIFCVQREDAEFFTPAAAIDPLYAAVLAEVREAGVRIAAYRAEVRPGSILLTGKLPVVLP
jgi:sugar fermentation stimulation protein A